MAKVVLYTRNILETGTVSVTGTADTGYPEARLYDRSIDFYWKDTNTTSYTVTVVQSSSDQRNVDFLAIERHNFNSKRLRWQSDTGSTAWADATTDWDSGTTPIIRELSTTVAKLKWRFSVATSSGIANPKASEVYMSAGSSFAVMAGPAPSAEELDNVQWNKTVGGLERATKFGDERRVRNYTLRLTTGELDTFRANMADTSGYSKPFYVKDHAGDYIFSRLSEPPVEDYFDKTYTNVNLRLIEVL